MGKEIVYCQGCGTNLREGDFEKGRAHVVDNRPFCSDCKPLPKTESPRPRKVSTGRIPVLAAPAARRPAPARPAKASNTPLLVGGIVAAIVVLMLLIVMAAGGGRTRGASGPAPEKDNAPVPARRPEPTDGALARIRELIREDTLFARRAEILALFDAAPRAGDTDRLRAEYDRNFEDAAKRLADFARGEANRLAAQNKTSEALRKCDEYLEAFGSSATAEAIRKLRQEIQQRRNP